MTELKVICAWCGKPMGTKDGEGTTGTSHGICPECEAKEFPQSPPDGQKFSENMKGTHLGLSGGDISGG